MFVSEKPDGYERVFSELLPELAELDLDRAAAELDGRRDGDGVWIGMLGRDYHVGPGGVFDAEDGVPDITIRIVLVWYLLRRGAGAPAGEFVAYREFKDAAFFSAFFQTEVEGRLARLFGDDAAGLKEAGRRLGGREGRDEFSGNAVIELTALPKIPVLVILYESDEDFPASASILFDANAEAFLDHECLAVLGQIVVDRLIEEAGGHG